MLFPLRRATSANVANIFENHVMLAHGVPETVIVDNGAPFTGSEFREVLVRYNIKVYADEVVGKSLSDSITKKIIPSH